MEGLYGWLRNITCYILFMSVIDNLLPGKKYGKYLKLFAGMVLILLVLQPLTGGMRLEDKIAHYYESFVFRYQADDLKKEIMGVEDQRLSQMITQYEEAVAQDVSQMARDDGMSVSGCQVKIEEDSEKETFGTVTKIGLSVTPDGEKAGTQETDDLAGPAAPAEMAAPADTPAPAETVALVESVRPVDPISVGKTKKEGPVVEDEAGRRQREQDRAAVEKLRRRIASYYNLEEAYVEIQIVEG